MTLRPVKVPKPLPPEDPQAGVTTYRAGSLFSMTDRR
jgi:hypothetical protein